MAFSYFRTWLRITYVESGLSREIGSEKHYSKCKRKEGQINTNRYPGHAARLISLPTVLTLNGIDCQSVLEKLSLFSASKQSLSQLTQNSCKKNLTCRLTDIRSGLNFISKVIEI